MLQKLIIVSFLVFNVLCFRSIFAQKIEKKHINYANGLSNSQISVIKQDSLGYIWLGTYGGGLYRWDGKDLKQSHDSLKYDLIRDVLPTPYGTWVLSKGEIYKIGLNNKIVSFTDSIYSRLKKADLRNDDQFLKIYKLSQKRYVLFSFSGRLLLINHYGKILDEVKLDEWGLKTSASSDTVYIYSNNEIVKVSTDGKKLKIKKAENIFDDILIEESKQTKVHFLDEEWWIQVHDKMIVTDQNFNIIDEFRLPSSSHIHHLKKWKNYIWIATIKGLYRSRLVKDEIKILEKEFALLIYHMLETPDGLWVGSINGMFHFTYPKMYLLEDKIEDENINGYFAFDIIDEKLWAGSVNSGIHIYDKKDLVKQIRFEEEMMNEVRTFLPEGDSVWTGTSAGLYKIHKETHQFRRIKEVKFKVLSLKSTEFGMVVGTAFEGLYIFNDSTIKHFDYNNGLTDPSIWALEEVNNTLFLGSESGVFTLNNDSIKKLKFNKRLNNAPVTSFEKINDSTIAIGFAKYGVIIYDLHKNQILHLFNDENGLSSSYIYFLKLINDKLWIGSSLGIDIVEIDAPFDVFQLQDLNKLAGAETFINGIIRYNDNIIATTIAGTLVVPKEYLEIKSEALNNFNPVIIEKAEPLSFSSVDDFLNLYQESKPLKIPFQHGSVKFHFNVAHFGAEKLNFTYQLEGYDEVNSTASDEKFAIYKQLPAGTYTFKVWRTFNNRKVGNPATLNFIITTPFYRTNWFLASVTTFIVLVVILYFIYREREKVAKEVEMMKIRELAQDDIRKEMAMDFHDEMGNHLAKIINLSGVLKMWGLQNEQEKVVNKIENAANSLFVSTKDLIWSLKKQNNDLEEVYFHTKDFAENLFNNSEINLRTDNGYLVNNIILNAKAARDLSLIIKEALTNAYKHSKAKNVYLKFEIMSEKQALISVSDDGCGCHDLNNKKGNGLKNMKQRAIRSDFHLEHYASKNSGCKILVIINQHKKQANV